MWQDPIVKETRGLREEYAEKFNHDPDAIFDLGLATWDESADTVTLSREAFVPQGDRVRMLGFLGDNVGDHLRAAVDNVLRDSRVHFEQAVFADGLTASSMDSVRPAVSAQWQALLTALVPALEERVAADAAEPGAQGRLRVGLYTYQEAGRTEAAAPPPVPPRRVPKRS